MTTKESTGVRIVTLKELWNIFVHRLWVMILAAAVAAGGLFLINRLTFVPAYSSTATLYILRQDSESAASSADSDFSLALKVVNDCDYLLKSYSVLDQVIQELDLDITQEDLEKQISTSNPDDTRILEVTVESSSPELAKQIVDILCEVGQEKITEAMGFRQVNLYEYGTLETDPRNITGQTTYLLVGAAVAILVYCIFLIAFLLDDRIRTEEDIERYLGLSILGDIPNSNERKNHQYGYYRAKDTQKEKKTRKKRGSE